MIVTPRWLVLLQASNPRTKSSCKFFSIKGPELAGIDSKVAASNLCGFKLRSCVCCESGETILDSGLVQSAEEICYGTASLGALVFRPRKAESTDDLTGREMDTHDGGKETYKMFSGNKLITAIELWALLIFGICMLLFLLLTPEQMDVLLGVRQIPTLSLTGAFQPMESIFTLGLHWLSVATCVFFILVYHMYRLRLSGEVPVQQLECCCCGCFCLMLTLPRLRGINQFLMFLGVTFSVFMSLVGAIPLSLNELGHAAVAIIMFVVGVVHVIIHQHTLARIDPPWTRRQALVRTAAYVLVFPLTVSLMLTVLFVFISCRTPDCDAYVVQMLVVVEFVTALGLIVYVESFRGVAMDEAFVCLLWGERGDRREGSAATQMQTQTQTQAQAQGHTLTQTPTPTPTRTRDRDRDSDRERERDQGQRRAELEPDDKESESGDEGGGTWVHSPGVESGFGSGSVLGSGSVSENPSEPKLRGGAGVVVPILRSLSSFLQVERARGEGR